MHETRIAPTPHKKSGMVMAITRRSALGVQEEQIRRTAVPKKRRRGTDGKGDADRVTSASEPLSGEGEGRRRQNHCIIRTRLRQRRREQASYDERCRNPRDKWSRRQGGPSTHEIRTVFCATNQDMPTGRVKEIAVFEDLFVGVEDSSSGKATLEMQDWDSHPNFEVAMGQSRTAGYEMTRKGHEGSLRPPHSGEIFRADVGSMPARTIAQILLSAWTATSGSDSVNLETEEKHLPMDTTPISSRRLRTNEWGAGPEVDPGLLQMVEKVDHLKEILTANQMTSIEVEDRGGCVSEGKGNGSKAVEARANDPGSNQKRGIGLAGLDQEPTLAAEGGQMTVTPELIGSNLKGLVLGCQQSNLTRAGIKGGADIFSRKEVVYKESRVRPSEGKTKVIVSCGGPGRETDEHTIREKKRKVHERRNDGDYAVECAVWTKR
ncbi:hypothetical protein EDB84DRAFT_1624673 [Lactarius hengduanensis]|nr:hypothetical protein EDB84DRAFT_1624673 [Lactarius hengduanensis]